MPIPVENTSSDLFDFLRNRYEISDGVDEEGQLTDDPSKAKVFSFDYINEEGENKGSVVISLLDDSESSNSLKIYFGQEIADADTETQKGWYKFLNDIRQFTKMHLLGFDVRNINKSRITKRDVEPMFESTFGPIDGTVKTSRQPLDNMEIIIKHSARIDPNVKNSRSRKIEKIYLANNKGEKFLLPFKSLLAARAMARHISTGGTPYDKIGTDICHLVEEMRSLNRFARSLRNHELLNPHVNDALEACRERYLEIRKQLTSLTTQRGYEKNHASLTGDAGQLPDDEEYTENLFDGIELDEENQLALPHVMRAYQRRAAARTAEEDEFTKWVQATKGNQPGKEILADSEEDEKSFSPAWKHGSMDSVAEPEEEYPAYVEDDPNVLADLHRVHNDEKLTESSPYSEKNELRQQWTSCEEYGHNFEINGESFESCVDCGEPRYKDDEPIDPIVAREREQLSGINLNDKYKIPYTEAYTPGKYKVIACIGDDQFRRTLCDSPTQVYIEIAKADLKNNGAWVEKDGKQIGGLQGSDDGGHYDSWDLNSEFSSEEYRKIYNYLRQKGKISENLDTKSDNLECVCHHKRDDHDEKGNCDFCDCPGFMLIKKKVNESFKYVKGEEFAPSFLSSNLKAAISFLNQKNPSYFKNHEFDFPDYAGLPKNIASKLTTDEVDYLQSQIYNLKKSLNKKVNEWFDTGSSKAPWEKNPVEEYELTIKFLKNLGFEENHEGYKSSDGKPLPSNCTIWHNSYYHILIIPDWGVSHQLHWAINRNRKMKSYGFGLSRLAAALLADQEFRDSAKNLYATYLGTPNPLLENNFQKHKGKLAGKKDKIYLKQHRKESKNHRPYEYGGMNGSISSPDEIAGGGLSFLESTNSIIDELITDYENLYITEADVPSSAGFSSPLSTPHVTLGSKFHTKKEIKKHENLTGKLSPLTLLNSPEKDKDDDGNDILNPTTIARTATNTGAKGSTGMLNPLNL